MEYRDFKRLVSGLREGYVAARRVEGRLAEGAAAGLRAAVLDVVRWGKRNRPYRLKRSILLKRRGVDLNAV